jgi:hypothetical protein
VTVHVWLTGLFLATGLVWVTGLLLVTSLQWVSGLHDDSGRGGVKEGFQEGLDRAPVGDGDFLDGMSIVVAWHK